MKKKKIVTVLIIIATLVLAGVAVYTAMRLYQLREEAVAPTAPESEPEAAASLGLDITSCETLAFTLAGPTTEPTAEPTDEPTAEPTAEPTDEPTVTPTTAPTAPTATPEPALPDAGVSFPTILGAGISILVILGSLVLIF